MVQLKIPDEFRKGQDIPFKITGAVTATADTYKIVNSEGRRVKLIGSYIKDNDFGDQIKGVIEDAKSKSYRLVAFGGDYSNPRNPIYDKKLAEFKSNVAELLPSKTMTDSNNSGGTDSKTSKIMQKLKENKLLIGAGAAGAGLLLFMSRGEN